MQMGLTEHIAIISWGQSPVVIGVVECRGTGRDGIAVPPSTAAGHRPPFRPPVFLADGDTFSETNCVRQPFARTEVGLYKTVVLINRLNLFWGIYWEALQHHVTSGRGLPDSDFLISCVDTRAPGRI